MEIRKPDLIAYVTAYGHYVPRLDDRGYERLPESVSPDREGYRTYLESCAAIIAPLLAGLPAEARALVHLSGGVMDSSGMPEGESGAQALRTLLLAESHVWQCSLAVGPLSQVPLPRCPTDGPQPIVCSEQLAWQVLMTKYAFPQAQVHYFVDEVRLPYAKKVLTLFALDKELGLDPVRGVASAESVSVHGVPRFDTHPNSTLEVQAHALELLNEQGPIALMLAKIAQATGRS